MTALETLAKCGLKSDVKSIRERLSFDSYSQIARQVFPDQDDYEPYIDRSILRGNLRSADLALLCSLAEKGERNEKAVKKELENAQSFIKFDGQKGQAAAIEYLLKSIITEAEGEGK